MLRFKDLQKKKRLRLFVQFFNKPNEDPFSPTYGNFLELRINEKRKIRRINWVFGPDDEFEGYHAEKCRGIKMKAGLQEGQDHLQAAEAVRALSQGPRLHHQLRVDAQVQGRALGRGLAG